ncbi:paladin-like [Sinocyclocheilus rhinocerous]|uniref:paladin-like n=1 Tax=Sinocyclocheilus rhinocerous TaxID=307959 RepID=UPI0007BA3E87|nr:PREDICTED: paladin-like [Sinocyclocheilus rhinocerous]
MGTTASAAPQPTLHESFHGNGMMDSSASFQTLNIHSNKAKSIITNKVAPVVITYNCRQEFQIHDDVLRTNYKVGRISDNMPEHHLVQGSYFMVQDVFSKADVLSTSGSYGAPNFRQSKGSFPLYGMGQPSLSGFKQVLQRLQGQGHQEVLFFCLREEPIVFLRLEGDFLPYTPRRKENLHENLHDLGRDARSENLELTIRKELHDFAKLNDNVFYIYNDIEHFKGEPQKISISCEEDMHVTEEVYKRPRFTMPSYRYYRLPLPTEGAPLEDEFDAFVNVLRGSSTKDYFLHRTLQSLERYFYLIVFNAYLHEQYPLAFACSFSQWLCSHAWMYRLLSCMNQSELRAPADLLTKGARVLVADEYLAPDVLSTIKQMKVANFRRVPKMSIYGMAQPTSEATGAVLEYLTDEKRKHSSVLWVNLQDELVVEANGQIFCPREPTRVDQHICVLSSQTHQIEKLETALKEELVGSQKWLEVTLEQEKQMKMFKSCVTVQETFNQHKSSHQGLQYRRIPFPECSSPTEEGFDRLLEAMKSCLAEDSLSAFVFNCSNGKGRTTTAMVIAALTLWHFNGFPESCEDEIVSVPDAKYTKGEFEVVMKLVRLLPDGHRMKREVDLALDSVSETMTPLHYHLREIIICSYRQIKSSKCETEIQALTLKSLLYLERYMYLILFNTYLHLEKRDSWQRSFSDWMLQVRSDVRLLQHRLEFFIKAYVAKKSTEHFRHHLC